MVSKKSKGFATIVVVALVAMLSLGLVSIPAANAAGSTTVVVTEADVARQAEDTAPLKNWVIYTRANTTGTATFRNGPGMPPLGTGSLEFTTPTGADKVFAFNFDYVGKKLSDISAIGYSTYRSAGSAQQVAALNMVIDFNGPAVAGGFSTLVFEPVYNTAQGSVVSGQWQTWDAYTNGVWWSTQPINGQCAGATDACDKTWAEIVANNPDATILGGFGINQGSGNPGLTTAVDALTIGVSGNTTVYNFELTPPPPPIVVATDKNQCKKGGWENVKRADGSSFKNQGDCVSYTNNGK